MEKTKNPTELIGHLSELRKRLILCFTTFALLFILCWVFKKTLLHIISIPILPYLDQGRLIFTAPMGEFTAHIKAVFFGSLVLGFPVFLFQLWSFLSPGLYKKEKTPLLLLALSGSLLFFLGISFVYFVVYPLSFKFLMNIGDSLPFISITEYLSFFISTSLVFGLLFETPLLIAGLSWLNILSVQQLKKGRKIALVILAVLSAVATPPDVLSMICVLIPLYSLYEASIWAVSLLKK